MGIKCILLLVKFINFKKHFNYYIHIYIFTMILKIKFIFKTILLLSKCLQEEIMIITSTYL